MTDRNDVLFFLHVMKTAGTTLMFRAIDSYGKQAVFPNADEDDQILAYLNIDSLDAIDPERRERTRFVSGHYPFAAIERLSGQFATCTVLRDPVERTISHLRQIRTNKDRWTHKALDAEDWDDPSFETLYDNPFMRRTFFVNYQTRIFATCADDHPDNHLDLVVLDDDRFETACRNLQSIDVIGLVEDYDAFIAELNRRFGLTDRPFPRVRVASDDWEVSEQLRARIAADNEMDRAFYDHATRLVAERRAAGAK